MADNRTDRPYWCEICARKKECYGITLKPKCFVPIANRKTESQTDCGDFADRLAYERGVKHAWEVAQKVFDSTVTFYEAEDVAKQITRDEPQTDLLVTEYPQDGEANLIGRGKTEAVVMAYDVYKELTEPQTEREDE